MAHAHSEVKLFEVRDRMTMIPVMAVRVDPGEGDDDYLLRRAGYRGRPYVIMTKLTSLECRSDPYDWNSLNGRTMRDAHLHLDEHWHCYQSGGVVDVEYMNGETDTPKRSERFD